MRNVIFLALSLVCVAVCLAQAPPTNRFQIWSKGYHYRQSLLNKPVTMTFTAVDGREVDLSRMLGDVVLVDFWETACEPCIAEVPRIKGTLEKYHAEGFEVIGITDDTDKSKLECWRRRELPGHSISMAGRV